MTLQTISRTTRGLLVKGVLVAALALAGIGSAVGAGPALAATPPSGLQVTGWTGDRMAVRWNTPADSSIVAYNVYASVSGGPFLFIRTVPAGGRNFTVLTQLFSGLEYRAYVTAVDASGLESAPSNIVSAGYGGGFTTPMDREAGESYTGLAGCDLGFGFGCFN